MRDSGFATQPLSVCASQTPPPTPTPTPSSSTVAWRAPLPLKTPIRGLIDLGQVSAVNMHEPPYNTLYYVCRRERAISGIVVNDTWQNLQPNKEGQRIRTAGIDAALRLIAAYNRYPAHRLGVRLRVWAGIDAPLWAQRLGGTPIDICDGNAVPATPTPAAMPAPTITPCPAVAIRTVGRFWSVRYEAAWRNLQKQLAAKYDTDPRVSEVSLSSCSSLTDEPFVLPEDSYSKKNLFAGGYTDAAFQACLANAVTRDYAPFWRVTPVDFSFNPFRAIQSSPAPTTDLAFTERTIDRCRAAVGKRCIFLNETMGKFTPVPSPSPGSTATPGIAANYYLMWRYMRERGGDITYQTASPPNLLKAWGTNLGGWNAAVSLAAAYGAGSLELFPPSRYSPCTDPPGRLWDNGYTCFTKYVLSTWSAKIRR